VCYDLAYASVPEVHTQLIMPQLKFIPKYEHPECMTGGHRLIACHIPGNLGIRPSTILSSEGPTSEPSTAFGSSPVLTAPSEPRQKMLM